MRGPTSAASSIATECCCRFSCIQLSFQLREVVGLFCMLLLLRGLAGKHLTDASMSAPLPLLKLRGSGQGDSFAIAWWWAAVNIHIQPQTALTRTTCVGKGSSKGRSGFAVFEFCQCVWALTSKRYTYRCMVTFLTYLQRLSLFVRGGRAAPIYVPLVFLDGEKLTAELGNIRGRSLLSGQRVVPDLSARYTRKIRSARMYLYGI